MIHYEKEATPEAEASEVNSKVESSLDKQLEELSDDLETLKKGVIEERARAEKYLSNWQRTQADFVNFKRRIEQEREETAKFANAELMSALLPVLDDFERALDNVPPGQIDANWIEGIRLICRKLRIALEAHGLEQIEALGKDFDPYLHHAVMHAEGEEGKVVEELQKGYKLHGRVLRPAMVKVGKGES